MINFNERLNEEQILPVTAGNGPILVFACAGSGKTRVLTYRIAYLIEAMQVNPSRILAIAFTNKAVDTMKGRVESLTYAYGTYISTFHSFCASQLREYANYLVGYNKNFTIYDEQDSKRTFDRVLAKYLQSSDQLKGMSPILRGKVSSLKNDGVTVDMVNEYLKDHNLFEEFESGMSSDMIYNLNKNLIVVYKEYQDELRKNNAMDFDDLLLNMCFLLRNEETVRELLQNKFDYILVDEFQDTNKVQNEIVKILANKHQNIFVVGDDDQSIYSWRGADISNILDFQNNFQNAQIFKLTCNYRCTDKIIEVAKNIINNNKARVEKDLAAKKSGGVRVEAKILYNDKAEVNYVINRIKSIHSLGTPLNEIAILVRSSYLTQPFESALMENGIKYIVYGGFKFFDRIEVKLTLNIITLLTNEKDNTAFMQIFNKIPGVGHASYAALEDVANKAGTSNYEAILKLDEFDLSTGIKNKLVKAKDVFLKIHKAYKENSIENFLLGFLNLTDIMSLIKCSTNIEKMEREENILQLVSDLYESIQKNPNSIVECLTQFALQSDSDKVTNGDALIISTIHSVKGMEFNTVFLVALEEDIMPNRKTLLDGSKLEEERRLMYVAVTRAKSRLVLTAAQNRFVFCRASYQEISRFLKESKLLDYNDSFAKIINDDALTHNDAYYERVRMQADSSKITKYFNKKPVSETSVDCSKYIVGQNVVHNTFGRGVIKEIEGLNATVFFYDLKSEKRLALKFAKLEII